MTTAIRAPTPAADDVARARRPLTPLPDHLSPLAGRPRRARAGAAAAAPLAGRWGAAATRSTTSRWRAGGVGERGRARLRAGRRGVRGRGEPHAGARSSWCATAGSWRAPRGTHRGRGMSMMRALMETVDVQHATRDDGRAAPDARGGGGMSALARVVDGVARRIPVAALTARSTPRTQPRSATGCAGWSTTARPRSSSTSRHDYLDSAGINLLFALGEELRARQQAMRLVSPAAHPSPGCSRSPASTGPIRPTRRRWTALGA